MQFKFEVFMEMLQEMLSFLPVTIYYTIIIFVSSLLCGVILAFLRRSNNKIIKAVVGVWMSFWRGTPQLAQLFFFVYAFFPSVPGLKTLPTAIAASLCMIFGSSAYMSETIRSAIDSIDKGQVEACYSIGMSGVQAMVRVVLPQAIRVAIPPLSNSFLDVLKGTSLLSTVGIMEMMQRARMISAVSFRYLESYSAMLVMFWTLNVIFTQFQKVLEKRMSKSIM